MRSGNKGVPGIMSISPVCCKMGLGEWIEFGEDPVGTKPRSLGFNMAALGSHQKSLSRGRP